MEYKLNYIKDVFGQNYIGIEFPMYVLSKYLNELKDILGNEYAEYVLNQTNRDMGTYHMTFCNTIQVGKMMKQMGPEKFIEIVNELFEISFDDIKLLGLGKACKNENTSYFVVVKSEQIDETKEILGLSHTDLHITIGFKHSDVHGVRKNEVMVKSNKFKSKLFKCFTECGDSFSFIRDIPKHPGDDGRISATFIGDSRAHFKVGDNKYIGITLIDDEIVISNVWESNGKIPTLSHTIIYRKFENL